MAPDERHLLPIALGLAAGLILPFALVHLDDADGVLYTVVARNLSRSGSLFRLTFAREVFPAFREHPPFFFWVWGLAYRAAGARALPFVGAACGLATVGLAFFTARPLVGRRAAFLGAVVLATVDSFFRYQARARLDPPLVTLFTLSVLLLSQARGRTALLAAGGLAAGLGVLVKGPPALGAPLAAAVVVAVSGRAYELRDARSWALVAAGALLPATGFLAYDHLALGGTWWRGYVEDQVLASLLHRRHDSQAGAGRGFLALDTVGRLGPWALAVAWAGWRALRNPRSASGRATFAFLGWAAVVLLGYAFASRTFWHYGMPAYVPLSLAAGVGLEDGLRRLGERAFGAVRSIAFAAALALAAALPFGAVTFNVEPCPLGTLPALANAAAGRSRGVAVVSPRAALAEAGILASHEELEPVIFHDAALLGSRPDLRVALLDADLPIPRGFREVAVHRGWRLAVRDAEERP